MIFIAPDGTHLAVDREGYRPAFGGVLPSKEAIELSHRVSSIEAKAEEIRNADLALIQRISDGSDYKSELGALRVLVKK